MGVKDDIKAFNHGIIKLAGNTDAMVDPTAFRYMENLIEDFVTQMSMKKFDIAKRISEINTDSEFVHISDTLTLFPNKIDGYHSFMMNHEHGPNVILFVNDHEFHIREDKGPSDNWSHLIESKNKHDLGYILSITLKHTREEINKLIFAMESEDHDESSKNILISTINNNAHNHGVKDFNKIKCIFFDINSVFINLIQDE